ncbi:MAG: protein kinase [Gemmatimonadales bacterium]
MSVTTSACFRCQTPLDPGARFCQVCGLSASGEQTAPLPTLLQILRQATLGEYEILREIGQGGMATVYLAHEIALDRKVAIKVMSPQFLHGVEMIERFKREARFAASLNHPHIIPIYAVKESQHLLYFIMKYIGGRSLDAILRDAGPLPFPMVRSILADVGSALDYAHRQGVIHRDVKPGNVMIDEEGFAVITDFGIAKAAEGETLTRSGTTVGTPSYLSPEACSGEVVGVAADQYSLGIVGYEMITGQLPFSADSSLGMMYAQVHSPPRPSQQLRPDCPPDLRDAIMRMLEKMPGDRFPTMKEASQAVMGGRISGGQVESGDDHVRSHIGLLAVPRPGRPVGEMRRTPASPAGLVRVPGTTTVRRQKRVKFTRVLVGLMLAGLGAAATWGAFQAREEAKLAADSLLAGPPVDPRADSILQSARGAATYARQRVMATGTPAIALASGDSLLARGESLAALGLKTEAAVLLTQATSLWTAAERPTVIQAPATSTKPTTPRENLPTTTPPLVDPLPSGSGEPRSAPVVSDSVAVTQFFAELERAVESRQLGEVRRLLPNMNETDERSWRGLFEDENIKSLEASYNIGLVSRRDDLVYARVKSEVIALKTNGKLETKRKTDDFITLSLGPQGWRQIRAQKAR